MNQGIIDRFKYKFEWSSFVKNKCYEGKPVQIHSNHESIHHVEEWVTEGLVIISEEHRVINGMIYTVCLTELGQAIMNFEQI